MGNWGYPDVGTWEAVTVHLHTNSDSTVVCTCAFTLIMWSQLCRTNPLYIIKNEQRLVTTTIIHKL